METINVGFSRPKKWKLFAWLIMKSLNIPYDHAYVKIYSNNYERFLIYQASHVMVNFMGLDVFNADNITISEFAIDVTGDNKKALMQFAIDNAGKPYGIKAIFGLAIVRIAELCGKTIKNPFRDGGNTYVCSELVSYLLQQYAGANISKDYEDMTPKDLYEYLSLLGNKVQ